MRVLLGAFDLFSTVGGGQTFYRNLIRCNPDIDFYFLQRKRRNDQVLPANAHAIKYRAVHRGWHFWGFADPQSPARAVDPFLTAENIAESVSDHEFDVVDVPDFELFGIFLRQALEHHGVRFRRILLSMHGVISKTIALNWMSDGNIDLSFRRMEELQYATVDSRYFISEMYKDEWHKICGLPSYYLDPMSFFQTPPRQRYTGEPDRPALAFVGRTEKRKGPHLFVDLLWWLPRDSYSRATIIGPACTSGDAPSSDYLRRLAEPRELDVEIVPGVDHDELSKVFASRTIVFAPSVYDTLNLVALESLFSGCPTVVGNGAGVGRYLVDRFPEVPFVSFDVHDVFRNYAKIEELILKYDEHRETLERALDRIDLAPRGMTIEDIYQASPVFDKPARMEVDSWWQCLNQFCERKVRMPRRWLARRAA